MKGKTIKAYLKKRINGWLETIEDGEVKKLAEENTIVTGGAIASLLLNEPPRDIDIYFKNKETVKAIAEYYVNQWNKEHGPTENNIGNKEPVFVLDGADVQNWKKGNLPLSSFAPNYIDHVDETQVSRMIANTTSDRIKIIYPSDGIVGNKTPSAVVEDMDETSEETLESEDEKKKYRPVFLTTNAVSLSGNIQLIIRFYGSPEEIHENYDFEHCCCYYDSFENELVTPEASLMAILNKDLFYRGSKYPVCSVFRTRKFIQRGWKINAGQYLKMCFQISNLDLTNVDVLEDQLVGVDTVYFIQVINSLRVKQQKDPNFVIDEHYVTSIVNKIF